LRKNVTSRKQRNLILPAVLYECEIWSLTLREEHRLRISEKRVLRRTSDVWSYVVTRRWKKLYNEELHNVYSSQIVIRMVKLWRWGGQLARMENNEYRLLVEEQKERDD
jgi:hypothetical protein